MFDQLQPAFDQHSTNVNLARQKQINHIFLMHYELYKLRKKTTEKFKNFFLSVLAIVPDLSFVRNTAHVQPYQAQRGWHLKGIFY